MGERDIQRGVGGQRRGRVSTVTGVTRRAIIGGAASPLVVLAACGQGGTEPAPNSSAAPVTLNVVTWPGAADANAYKRIAADFSATRPNITVKVDETPLPAGQDQETKLKTMLAAGVAPDLAQTQTASALLFARLKAVRPLDTLLSASKVAVKDLMAPAMEAATRFDGKVVNIPADTQLFVVWLNKDWFAEANVPLPKPDWTWDDLAETARKLTKGTGDEKKWGFQADMFWSRFEPWIYQSGGKPFDQVNFPTKTLIDQPDAIGAIQFVQDMTVKAQSMISPQAKATWSQANAYNFPWRRGAVAMEFGHTGGLRDFPKQIGFKYEPVPLPRKAKASTTFVTNTLVIFNGPTAVDATWQLLRFAVSEAGQKYVVSEASRMPPRKDLAEKLFLPFARQDGGVPNPQAFVNGFDSGIPQTNTPAIFRIQNEWLVPTWAKMMNGGESVRDHMLAGAPFINQVLKDIG